MRVLKMSDVVNDVSLAFCISITAHPAAPTWLYSAA
jgi:hypothetical protein